MKPGTIRKRFFAHTTHCFLGWDLYIRDTPDWKLPSSNIVFQNMRLHRSIHTTGHSAFHLNIVMTTRWCKNWTVETFWFHFYHQGRFLTTPSVCSPPAGPGSTFPERAHHATPSPVAGNDWYNATRPQLAKRIGSTIQPRHRICLND